MYKKVTPFLVVLGFLSYLFLPLSAKAMEDEGHAYTGKTAKGKRTVSSARRTVDLKEDSKCSKIMKKFNLGKQEAPDNLLIKLIDLYFPQLMKLVEKGSKAAGFYALKMQAARHVASANLVIQDCDEYIEYPWLREAYDLDNFLTRMESAVQALSDPLLNGMEDKIPSKLQELAMRLMSISMVIPFDRKLFPLEVGIFAFKQSSARGYGLSQSYIENAEELLGKFKKMTESAVAEDNESARVFDAEGTRKPVEVEEAMDPVNTADAEDVASSS